MDDFFKGPLQFSGLKTFLLSLRIISSYTVHLSLFINRILKGGHIDPIKSLVGLTSHRHLLKDALWSYERFASHCVTPLCCSRCPFQYLSLSNQNKLLTLDFLFCRQFYSSRESARYRMPEWFISVGQVSVSKSNMFLKSNCLL